MSRSKYSGRPPSTAPRLWARCRDALALVAVLLALAACGGEGQPSPAGTGTVAYLVTSCRQTGGTMTLQQEVRILHGEAEAVTVLPVGPLGPFPGIGCGLWGFYRRWLYMQWGPLQRFGTTPDGSGIIYELTDEFVQEGRGVLPAEQRGIYYMRADGSGLRRLGPASHAPTVVYSPTGTSWLEYGFAFDPGGEEFTYVDRGPDEAGHDAAEVFLRGLTPGDATQVTHLPALDVPWQWPEVAVPRFLDARTIWFTRWTQPPTGYEFLRVDVDGTQLGDVPVVAVPGGQFVPVFEIVGGRWAAIYVDLPGVPVNPIGDYAIREVFVVDSHDVLQLTNFRRSDTSSWPGFYSARDERVYFTASADPFGTNPSENCQIFSIDPLSMDLRQVTFFRESAAHATNGCLGGGRPYGCRVDFQWFGLNPSQDPHTGTIFFKSTCDPFGLNPDGWQLFAIQPDGSGLRQLTSVRGRVRTPDGSIEVENVDAFWWRAPPAG
jgi:hypothetical protein